MNERIKELADRTWRKTNKWASDEFCEEFAKFIIKECVAICQDIDGEDNIDARSGRQDCAVEIREHFGIE